MALFRKRDKSASSQSSKTDWPQINDLLWARLPCCETAIHPSRVEGTDGGDLVIAAPSKPHQNQVVLPAPDKTFVVGWREGISSKQVRVQALSEGDDEVPTWTIRAVAESELVQRRKFVRASWNSDIVLYLPTVEGAVTGTILDISEGGVRCQLPATNEPRNPKFQVSFSLNDSPLLLLAEIAWWGDASGENVVVGLQFSDLQPMVSDQLRALAFDLQMKERRDRRH